MGQQSPDNMRQLEDHSANEKIRFPMKVGIIFLGKKWDWFLKQSRLHLDFNGLACAHIILQMNHIQNLFEFQILTPCDVCDKIKMDIEDVSILIECKSHDKYTFQWMEGRKDSPEGRSRICKDIEGYNTEQWKDTKKTERPNYIV